MDAGDKGGWQSDYSTRRRLNGGRRHEAAEVIGSGNRERRQERIRELTEKGTAGGERLNGSRDGRPGQKPASRKTASAGLLPSQSHREASQPPSAEQAGDGPFGTRIYAPPHTEWDDIREEAFLEAWPQPSSKDPELEWKRSSNPWQRLEEASGLASTLRSPSTRGSSGGRRPGRGAGGFRRDLQVKLLLSAILFGSVYGLFQLSGEPARQGQALVTEALTEQMDFTRLAGIYNSVFAGAPSFIPGFGTKDQGQSASVGGAIKAETVSPLPGGTIVKTFPELLGGVELAGQPGAAVGAAEQGRVQIVSADDVKGPTVVIQHTDGRMTYYGQLGQATVQVNDWVAAGQEIGKLGMSASDGGSPRLYFAVKDNDRYIDPTEVIPLD